MAKKGSSGHRRFRSSARYFANMLRRTAGTVQGAKQCRAFLQAQGFGPGRGLYFCFRQRRAQCSFRIAGLQVIPQCLPFLAEGKLQEIDKALLAVAVFVQAKFFLSRSHGKAQNRGVHFGRRSESARRQRDQLFHLRIQLRRSGKQAVIAAAGFGGLSYSDINSKLRLIISTQLKFKRLFSLSAPFCFS